MLIDRSLNYGRHHIQRFLHHATGISPVKAILDIGAGRGDDLQLARKVNPAAELHAIEVYPEYQNELREKSITVYSLNVERHPFPFSDESFDVVIANQILEHLKEIFWVLHEVSRVLQVGGFFIIGVPNLASLHNRLLLLLGKQPSCIQNHSAHVRGYTRNDLLKIFHLCYPGGFKLIKFGGSNFYPFPPLLARPLAAVLPTMAWGIFLLLQKQRPYDQDFLAYPADHQLETNFYKGKD
jgi:ubiquinone/menaquinone biosynthesis C-methylase UbiE